MRLLLYGHHEKDPQFIEQPYTSCWRILATRTMPHKVCKVEPCKYGVYIPLGLTRPICFDISWGIPNGAKIALPVGHKKLLPRREERYTCKISFTDLSISLSIYEAVYLPPTRPLSAWTTSHPTAVNSSSHHPWASSVAGIMQGLIATISRKA